MLLVLFALVFALGAPGSPATAPSSQLPATQPGLSRDEGVFLATSTADGFQAIYFIAQNLRHSILNNDLLVERQLNPLWPVRGADADEVLAFDEGAPVGAARAGLLNSVVAQDAAPEAVGASAEAAPEAVGASAEAAPDADLVAGDVHVVDPGDTLTRLSNRYGTDVSAIQEANGLTSPDRITVGQSLVIPGTPAPEATVVANEEQASESSGTASATTYTVQHGDSAFLIARRFSVPEADLLDTNNIANPNRVYVGQVLEIPNE